MQELSLNVLDIAQNSVVAKASLIRISVEEDTCQHRMVIIIADNGCGMDEEKVKRVIDPFYTTRTTRKVGLGIPFFSMQAKMTGGDFSIDSKVGEGTTVTASFVTDHIDCLPLGDINSTIVSLVQCNPDIDFLYTRTIDGRTFEMDTRVFREVLEGVPLNTPEVIVYITDYLAEQTQMIQGERTEE